MIAKSYVYVVQVAMGTSQAQYFSRRPRTPLNKLNAVSNVVVVDTEVYSCYGCEHLNIKSNEVSNTGGQSSKATNTSKIKSMTVKNATGCFSIYGCSVLLGLRWG